MYKKVLKNNCPWSDAMAFKKYLKIPYYEKVKMKDIEKIEEYLKVSINVSGDHLYCSKLKSNKDINLKLINEHYTLNIKPMKEVLNNNRKVSFYDKKPIIYDTVSFNCFDGKNEHILNKEERNKIYNWETPYIIINKSKDKTLTLNDEYNKFLYDADILLKATDNIINLYKTGNNKATALNLFYSMNKHINADDIEQIEAEYINNSSFGALVYANKGIYNNVYKYDVVSMYPSIMKSIQLFPIKQGEFIQLNDNDFYNVPFLKYGVYRCIIKGNTNLFKFDNLNYYTHIDISTAKELKLNIELIHDDQPNFLYIQLRVLNYSGNM